MNPSENMKNHKERIDEIIKRIRMNILILSSVKKNLNQAERKEIESMEIFANKIIIELCIVKEIAIQFYLKESIFFSSLIEVIGIQLEKLIGFTEKLIGFTEKRTY